MNKCMNCKFFVALNELDDLDREAAGDGYTGCCDLDDLYTVDDYSCKYYCCKE